MKIKSTNKYLFVLFLLIASLACASAAAAGLTVNAAAPGANLNAVPTPTPKIPASVKSAVSPELLVTDLYKQHDAQKGPFFQTKDRALVDKYFTKKTADLIWKDAVTSAGEVGALDGDPLYDTQDAEIKNLAIGKADIEGETATVPVTFQNFDKKRRFTFSLKQENSKWKIEDIKYDSDDEGYSLVKILSDTTSTEMTGDDQTASAGEFEGTYRIGETTCTVKPIKMAFEVKWAKGTGTEIFFSQDRANDKYIFASDPKKGKANVFSFDDENYNTGTFFRADGKEFPIKRVK